MLRSAGVARARATPSRRRAMRMVEKILGRNFSKIGENFIFVFLQSQVASDSKTNLLFEKLDPNYGGGVAQGFSSRGLKCL